MASANGQTAIDDNVFHLSDMLAARAADESAVATTATVQSVVAGELPGQQHVTLKGKQFRIANSVGLMPLLRFAYTASRGIDSGDMDGLAALYSVLRDCIIDVDSETGEPTEASLREWSRFEEHADRTKAEGEDLMPVVTETIQILTSRPRKQPGNSSAGLQNTSAGSKASSSSPDIEELAGLIPVADLVR